MNTGTHAWRLGARSISSSSASVILGGVRRICEANVRL